MKNSLRNYTNEINVNSHCIETVAEFAAIDIKFKKQKITIIGVYRSPNYNTDNVFNNLDNIMTTYLLTQIKIKEL